MKSCDFSQIKCHYCLKSKKTLEGDVTRNIIEACFKPNKKNLISFNKWWLNEIFKIPLISQELKSRPCLVQIKLKKGHLTKCNEFFAK
jgi:hypothetical protein